MRCMGLMKSWVNKNRKNRKIGARKVNRGGQDGSLSLLVDEWSGEYMRVA